MSLLFNEDAYLRSCEAVVVHGETEGIVVSSTIFYPMGGGQPGDTGQMRWDDKVIPIVDTRRGASPDTVLHLPGTESGLLPEPGMNVTLELDWERRYRHMKMHTCMHLLCSLIDGDVTGGQIGADKSRLDFNIPGSAADKQSLTDSLNELIAADHAISARWIEETEIDSNPGLVRTMSVTPPRGHGRVRVLDIEGVDLQPCGGTHVRRTGEIGPVTVTKIENKGRQNRRISVALVN